MRRSLPRAVRWFSTERPLHWVLILVALGILHVSYEWFLTTRWQARAARWQAATAELAELQAQVDSTKTWSGEVTLSLVAIQTELRSVKRELAMVAAACGAEGPPPARMSGVRFGRPGR